MYSSLTKEVNKNPQLASQVMNVFAKALQNKQNDFEALMHAGETYGAITRADPSLQPEAARVLAASLNRYEEKITPKTKIQKIWQYLNDRDNGYSREKEAIKFLRDNLNSEVGKDNLAERAVLSEKSRVK